MALKLKGSTSGFVAVDCAAEGGNNTLILPSSNGVAGAIWANNVDTAGVATCTSITINKNGDLTVPGTVSVGGTLTYEDVTNVDVVGLVTAAQGVRINGGGLSIIGVTTGFNSSGISTFNDDVVFTGAAANVTWDKSTDDLKFNDDAQAKFGTAGDLSIYHGSNINYIKALASTNTEIWSDTFYVKSVTGPGEAILKGSANGSVELYHDNLKKIETTSGGITVTNSTATAITVVSANDQDGGIYFNDGSNRGGVIYQHNGDYMSFRTAGTDDRIRIASDGSMGLGTIPETDGQANSLYFANGNANIWGSGNVNLYTCVNARYTGTAWKYNNTAPASYVGQQNGVWNFFNAPSGTADATVTFTERMRIDASGRLLLGTTTEGNAAADDLTVATSGDTGITIRSGTGNSGQLYFSDATSGAGEYDGAVEFSHSTQAMKIYTAGVARVTIGSTGNFGIGDATPTKPLTIGTTVPVILLDDQSSRTMEIRGGSTSYSPSIITTYASDFLIGTNSTERFRITSAGKVRVGSGSPSYNFEVQNSGAVEVLIGSTDAGSAGIILDGDSNGDGGGSDYCQIQHTTAGNLQFTARKIGSGSDTIFVSGGTEVMRINADNDVQIGTTARLTAYGTGNRLTIYKGDANGGILELGGNTNADAYNVGTILFNNTNNSNASQWQADSVLVAAFRAETITTDSNAGDDSGADLAFYTKPEAAGGYESMRIHGEGWITTPKQPFFRAHGSSSWVSIATGDGTIVMPFATQVTDRGNNYNTTNSRFTAPVGGAYVFHVTMYGKSNSASGYMSFYFRRNGSGSSQQYRLRDYSDEHEKDASWDYTWCQSLNAGDYIDFTANADGDTWQYYGSHCSFMGYLLG